MVLIWGGDPDITRPLFAATVSPLPRRKNEATAMRESANFRIVPSTEDSFICGSRCAFRLGVQSRSAVARRKKQGEMTFVPHHVSYMLIFLMNIGLSNFDVISIARSYAPIR